MVEVTVTVVEMGLVATMMVSVTVTLKMAARGPIEGNCSIAVPATSNIPRNRNRRCSC